MYREVCSIAIHLYCDILLTTTSETIQPTVVHTTVPIHEVHHNAAQVHSTSALPVVSMADFKKQGGVLTGREERFDGFEGEPRSVGGALGAAGAEIGSTHSHHHSSTTGSTGIMGAAKEEYREHKAEKAAEKY